MQPIKKKHPPAGLLSYRQHSVNPTYKEFSEDEPYINAFFELREALVQEQKYLCCYCLQKIEIVKGEAPKMKTEHFLPKDVTKYPQYELEYENLLAACLGNETELGKDKHCDVTKKNNTLQFLKNPATRAFRRVLDYQVLPRQKEVRIVCAEPYRNNDALQKDIQLLNLNEQSLRSRRFTVWNATWRKLGLTEITNVEQLTAKQIRILREILDTTGPNTKVERCLEFSDMIFAFFSKRFQNELKNG